MQTRIVLGPHFCSVCFLPAVASPGASKSIVSPSSPWASAWEPSGHQAGALAPEKERDGADEREQTAEERPQESTTGQQRWRQHVKALNASWQEMSMERGRRQRLAQRKGTCTRASGFCPHRSEGLEARGEEYHWRRALLDVRLGLTMESFFSEAEERCVRLFSCSDGQV